LSKPDSRPPSKAEVISWALQKLGQDDFHFTVEGPDGGWELNIWEYEREPEEPPLTPEEQTGVKGLARALLNADFLRKMAASMGKETDADVLREFLQSPLAQFLGQELVRLRLRIATRNEATAEELAIGAASSEVAQTIVLALVSELASRFPKMVRRAEELRVVAAETPVPDDVQDYMEEASRCYVAGNYVACLLVCRSAVEFAVQERLLAAGCGTEVEALRKDHRDSLYNLIELAKIRLHWSCREMLVQADRVREKGKRAAHRQAPSAAECKEMFRLTRHVLENLYSDPARGVFAR